MHDDSSHPPLSAFRSVPRTGVIYVTTEAMKVGFAPTDPEWCNLGQGQPETGPLPGAPPRVPSITIDPNDLEYAPVPGIWELRETIATLYNQLYRRGLPSQYSAENVSVSGGGRAGQLAGLGHALAEVAPLGVGLREAAAGRFGGDVDDAGARHRAKRVDRGVFHQAAYTSATCASV